MTSNELIKMITSKDGVVIRNYIVLGCMDPVYVYIKDMTVEPEFFSFIVVEHLHPKFNGIFVGKNVIGKDTITKAVVGALRFSLEELFPNEEIPDIEQLVNVEKVEPFVWKVTIREVHEEWQKPTISS